MQVLEDVVGDIFLMHLLAGVKISGFKVVSGSRKIFQLIIDIGSFAAGS